MENALREEVRRRGLKECVEFPGWQDPKIYLAFADVVVSTSLHESWGASIIESLAAGVSTIAPDVGIAKDAGATIVAPAQMVEAAAQALAAPVRGQLLLPMFSESAWAQAWRNSL
jgi:glycosyltransferase involved in cell wall biosynthesis